MPSDGLRTTFCRFLCMSWHLHVLAPRVCILVVRAHQDRSVRNEGHSPTKYDHREGSEGRERHVRRSARFFFPRRFLHQRGEACYQQSGPRTSDLAERFTGPSRECMEWLGEMRPSAYDVYSWFAGCASRALESAPKWSTSESSRARQSVNPAAAVISSGAPLAALKDSNFSEDINGILCS